MGEMKKIFALVMAAAILGTMATTSLGQGRSRRHDNVSQSRSVQTNYDRRSSYYDYGQYRDRSFWDRHRDKITVAAGTGAGAAVGGMIGGKKGAIIGALAGLGGSALYTYKIRH